MQGSVVLNKIANGSSQNFPVMDGFLFPGLVAIQSFCSLGDGGGGYLNPFLLEPVGQGRIVIVMDGQLFIVDQGFIPE